MKPLLPKTTIPLFVVLAGHLQAFVMPNSVPAVNQRFASGFTATPILNTDPSFLGAGYDLSGVGWVANSGLTSIIASGRVQNLTMISPLNFAMAAHYSTGFVYDGAQLRFVNSNGSLLAVTAASLTIPSPTMEDLSIGTLSTAFAPSQNVQAYRILDVATQDYVNLASLPYGSNVDDKGPLIAPAQMTSYASFNNPGGLVYWETGDSGSPMFLPYTDANGIKQLTFTGTAWFSTSVCSYLPSSTRNPVPSVNNTLRATGYALQWTIYDNPSDAARTAPKWTGGSGSGELSTTANWSSGAVPSGLPVLFNADTAGGQTALSLATATSLRGVLFKTSPSSTGFTLSGTGPLTLDYTGIRNESAATQTLNVPITLSNGQNWDAINGPLIFTGAINTGTSNLLSVGGGANTTINGVISGSGSLAKDGSGTLLLAGLSTYSGGNTFIHNGTVRLAAGAHLPQANLAFIGPGTAVFDLNGNAQEVSELFSNYGGTGQILLGAAGGTLTVNPTGNGSIPYAGTIAGTGTWIKGSTGTLTLTGTDTHSGTTRLTKSALRLASAGALSPNANLEMTGNSASSTVLELGYGDFTAALGTAPGQVSFVSAADLGNVGFAAYGGNRIVNLGGAGAQITWDTGSFLLGDDRLVLASASATGTLDFQNPINLAGAWRNFLVADGSASVDARLSGALSNGTIIKSDTGTLELTGTNTYAGYTLLYGGALRVSTPSALPASTNLQFYGGVLELGNGDFTRPLGTGNGQVHFATNGGFSAYGATRAVNLGGASATMIWGSTPSFSGAGSVLILSSKSANALVDFQNPIDLNSAARTVQVDDGGAAVDARLSGVLSNGALTKTGTGTLEITGANTYAGATTLSAGTLRISTAAALPVASNIVMSGGVLEMSGGDFTQSAGTGGGQINFTGSGGFSASGATRTINIGGAATTLVWGSSANFLANGSSLILSSTSSDAMVNLVNPLNFNGATRTVQVNDGSAVIDARLSGDLSNGGLVKTGAGLLDLNGNNSYIGTTTVSAGTLRLTSATALPASSNLNINGGIIELANGNFNRTLGTGAGQVQFTGSGGFAASGADRVLYFGTQFSNLTWASTTGFLTTGQTWILSSPSSSGTLWIQNSLILGTGAPELRTIQVNNGSAAVDARIYGNVQSSNYPQRLAKTGLGTLELIGPDNRIGGGITISAGTLLMSGGLSLTGTITVQPSATFTYTKNADLGAAVALNGGTFLYQSATAYSGALTFTAGTLGGSGNLRNTALTIGSGRTIAPGSSPGTLQTGAEVWTDGGTYQWEINSLTGTKGSAWDWLDISDTLTVSASTGSFVINVDSLGSLSGWNNQVARTWTLATATNGIIGVQANRFTINSTAFADENPLGGGTFSIAVSGNDLNLVFTPAYTLIQAWRAANGLPVDGSGIGADSYDASGNGMPNLLKYALGLPANTTSLAALPVVSAQEDRLTISFQRNPALTDINYAVEASSDLAGTWTQIASSLAGGAMTNLGGAFSVSETGTNLRVVTVADLPLISSTPRRFLRLKILKP